MSELNFSIKIKEIQENIQREMHTQMDSLEYAYLVEEKTHFERMGIIQYLTILTIFTAAVFLLKYYVFHASNTYAQKFVYYVCIGAVTINGLYFLFDAVLCYLYKKGKDHQCLWNVMCWCQKIVGYMMMVIGAEVTFWCIFASMIFKSIHMDKLQKNSVSVVFSFVMSLEATFVLGVWIYRHQIIDLFRRESRGYFYFTLILLGVFWIIYSLLLRWCCTYIGTAEDFAQVVEETKILLFVVFLLMLLFVYGKNWSTIDGAEPIMQSVANAIAVVLLVDTIVTKARESE